MKPKDKNGKLLQIRDLVKCNELYFEIEYFEELKYDQIMACGDYGCFNASILELVEPAQN